MSLTHSTGVRKIQQNIFKSNNSSLILIIALILKDKIKISYKSLSFYYRIQSLKLFTIFTIISQQLKMNDFEKIPEDEGDGILMRCFGQSRTENRQRTAYWGGNNNNISFVIRLI